MKSKSLMGAGLAAVAVLPTPASAQRTEENAVDSAEDAFGTSVGNERVGIYFPQSARGFSPVQAGNVRINGMYFDYQTDLNSRLISGSNVRVGLTAQGYPFPAPTGVADFSLRLPGSTALASTVFGYGPFGGPRLEIDAQIPLNEDLGIAGGIGINAEEQAYGGHKRVLTAAVVARWQPSEGIEIIPFWSGQDTSGDEGQPIIQTAGAFLPPEIERRRYFGPEWATNEAQGFNYGVLATGVFGPWALRAGAFRSVSDSDRNFNVLFRNTSPTGESDRRVVREDGARNAATSGELRLSREIVEGERLHTLHLMTRGRMKDRLYGGSRSFDFGRGRIDEVLAAPEPSFTPGPQTTDSVRQATFGLGYEGRWRGVGELSLGVQRTFYKKFVVRPSGALPTSEADPWLFNATLSTLVGENLVFYAGYSKGLEESPIAPEIAVNRGEAPPAIITRQMDAGVRYAFTPSLRLVAGVFDVRKPHFGLDPSATFRELGSRRNRGVELSFAGQLTPRLSTVVGVLLLDAKVSGDAVDLGLIGSRPVGFFGTNINAAINWTMPWIEGLSLDANYERSSDRTANAANTFVIPARYVASVGARYRFDVAGKPATLRAQMASVNNQFGYSNLGEGFYYNPPRRFQASLTIDF